MSKPSVRPFETRTRRAGVWRVNTVLAVAALFTPVLHAAERYTGTPFQGRIQSIPGTLECELYDEGGEGVAYHETDGRNHGSGELNKSNSERDTFRKDEDVDISFTKNDWDNSAFNFVTQELGRFYLGWTEPDEWVRYTVNIAEEGHYSLGVMYTSRYGGGFTLEWDCRAVGTPVRLASTANDQDERRNWHHWNYHKQEETVFLPAGRHVLTIKILDPGNLNLDSINFSLAASREATTAFDVELDLTDADLWTMDTVHLGTKQVKITCDAANRTAVMTPTWSAGDRESADVGVRNVENSVLQLYQLIEARDCTQGVSYFEIDMPQAYIDEGKLELVFALQAGAKGDYLFNGRSFTMKDFANSSGRYKKMVVRAPDYNEPSEKLRAIERVGFIFERKGSVVSAPIKIRRIRMALNSDKITQPTKVARVKNPISFYEFTYTTQSDVDGLEARVSAESMDITRRVNDAQDGVVLIPQWKEGQIPAGHSGRVTLVQPLGAINDFDKFEGQYVLNIPKAYFDEGKLGLWLFIQAGETGYHRWSGTARPLASFADQAGEDVVLTVTEKDFLKGKKRNQIEVMGLQLNCNGSTLTEPIMLKRITVKLPE